MDGIGELKGWQWLFLIEGALTVVMGIYVAFTLADLPSNVSTVYSDHSVLFGMLDYYMADVNWRLLSEGPYKGEPH